MIRLGGGPGLASTKLNREVAWHRRQVDSLAHAIADHRLVEARHNGLAVLLAPYALHRSADGHGVLLAACVLRAEDPRLLTWAPQDLALDRITHEKVLEDRFVPSQAFDPAAYAGRLLRAVPPAP